MPAEPGQGSSSAGESRPAGESRVSGWTSGLPVLSTTTRSAGVTQPRAQRAGRVQRGRPLRGQQQPVGGRALGPGGQHVGVVDRDRGAAGLAQDPQQLRSAERRRRR